MTEENAQLQYNNNQLQYKISHENESPYVPEHSPSYDVESQSSPHMADEYPDESSSLMQPKAGDGYPNGMSTHKVGAKKAKKLYDQHYHHAYVPGHVPMKHKHTKKPVHYGCPPSGGHQPYGMQNCYIPPQIPVIQPIIHVYRYNIVNVPKYYYQPVSKNVVIDPNYPRKPYPGPSANY